MFCDLSIVYQSNVAVMAKILNHVRAAGYDVVAINHIVTEKLTPNHVNPIPKMLEEISKVKSNCLNLTYMVSNPLADICDFETDKFVPPTIGAGGIISRGWSGLGGLKVLSRLTLKLSDASTGQCINNCPTATKQYDIIAVQPTNEQTLGQALQSLDVDLIAFDLAKALPRAFQHRTVQPAKERGIYFEIPYVPAIHDPISRRHLFYNGNNLIRALHGTNVIFTSQAMTPLDIRGPYDVANLGNLLEINQAMAKKMLTSGPMSLITKSETRKYTEKAIVAVSDDVNIAGCPSSEQTGSKSRGAEDPPAYSNPAKKPKTGFT